MPLHPLLSCCRFQLLSLSNRRHQLNGRFEGYLVLSGALLAQCPPQNVLAQPGDVLFFQPYQPYQLSKISEANEVLHLSLHPDFFRLAFPDCGRTHLDVPVRLSDPYPRCRAHLLRAAEALFSGRYAWELSCSTELYQLFEQLYARFPPISAPSASGRRGLREQRLTQILLYCDRHYTQKFSVQELARQSGLSASYLSHWFKSETGISLQEHICQLRMEHACRLIAQTEQSLSDICFASGFSDYRYFNREFQQQYHCSARQFRRRCRESGAYPPELGDRFAGADAAADPEHSLIRVRAALKCLSPAR